MLTDCFTLETSEEDRYAAKWLRWIELEMAASYKPREVRTYDYLTCTLLPDPELTLVFNSRTPIEIKEGEAS